MAALDSENTQCRDLRRRCKRQPLESVAIGPARKTLLGRIRRNGRHPRTIEREQKNAEALPSAWLTRLENVSRVAQDAPRGPGQSLAPKPRQKRPVIQLRASSRRAAARRASTSWTSPM